MIKDWYYRNEYCALIRVSVYSAPSISGPGVRWSIIFNGSSINSMDERKNIMRVMLEWYSFEFELGNKSRNLELCMEFFEIGWNAFLRRKLQSISENAEISFVNHAGGRTFLWYGLPCMNMQTESKFYRLFPVCFNFGVGLERSMLQEIFFNGEDNICNGSKCISCTFFHCILRVVLFCRLINLMLKVF